MRILGLTGPTGAGKGAVASILAQHGIPVIDADAVYHALLRESLPMTDELARAFGDDILNAESKVDRKRLGQAVFGKENTPDLLKALNTITHKYVVGAIREQLAAWEQNDTVAAVIDAPQLFEAGLESVCEAVIGVLATPDVRLTRIMERDRITKDAAINRINAQKPDDFFLSNCHYILENNGDLHALSVRVEALLTTLQLKESLS